MRIPSAAPPPYTTGRRLRASLIRHMHVYALITLYRMSRCITGSANCTVITSWTDPSLLQASARGPPCRSLSRRSRSCRPLTTRLRPMRAPPRRKS